MVTVAKQSGVFVKNRISIDFGCYATSIACNLFSFYYCEIKGPLYCLNAWLLSEKCRQRERTSMKEGLRLPNKSTVNFYMQ